MFGHVHEGYGREWLRFDALHEAYERVLTTGGLWNVVRLMAEFMRGMFYQGTRSKSLLVNACVVGGLRDDERRKPIIVHI